MPILPGSSSVLGGVNVSPFGGTFPAPITIQASPTQYDSGPLGQMWINTLTQQVFILVYAAKDNAIWLPVQSSSQGGFIWQVVTVDTPMVSGHGYLTNPADVEVPINLSLPVQAQVGDSFWVSIFGLESNDPDQSYWNITQNAGQSIIYETEQTTVGTGGSLTQSSDEGGIVFLVCTVANTTFQIMHTDGVLTFN